MSNQVNSAAAAAVAAAATPRPVSAAQLEANRANAQKSCGPVTSEGRKKVSLNALKTGLTGQTVLLADDDLAAYQAHLDRNVVQFSPATDQERTLVQFLSDTEWRLFRIAPLEAAIWARGRRTFADHFADEADASVRDGLIKLEILDTYRKDFNNLALQERRLRNHYKSDLERLQALQKGRQEKVLADAAKLRSDMSRASAMLERCKQRNFPFDPTLYGFEFSVEEIEHYCAEYARIRPVTLFDPPVDKVLAAFRQAKKASSAA